MLLLSTGCTQTPAVDAQEIDTFVFLETPARPVSGQPKLVKSPGGALFLSWVQINADSSSTLKIARFEGDAWRPPLDAATGTDWFINWADFPTMAVHDTRTIAASYLARNGDSKYAYDIYLTASNDGGATWLPAFRPHLDGTPSEHGFVSLLPWKDGNFFAAWLDGRNTVSGHDQEDAGHGTGAMTLRAAFFGPDGALSGEVQLDARTCDCCQTAAVRIGAGSILVAYRDRDENEIRDISVIRYENGDWSSPGLVHADGWQIPGCPVNGPALDSFGGHAAVAWYSAARDTPRVYVSLSSDLGASFSPPLSVDDGNPAGRVAVAFSDQASVYVSWIEKTTEGAEIRIRRVSMDRQNSLQKSASFKINSISPVRQSGFPQMAVSGEKIVFAWTEVQGEGKTVIRSAYANKRDLAELLQPPS